MKTTETQRIRHYVQHGDQRCATCQSGFVAYWISKAHK